jgi:hypothetical protein
MIRQGVVATKEKAPATTMATPYHEEASAHRSNFFIASM